MVCFSLLLSVTATIALSTISNAIPNPAAAGMLIPSSHDHDKPPTVRSPQPQDIVNSSISDPFLPSSLQSYDPISKRGMGLYETMIRIGVIGNLYVSWRHWENTRAPGAQSFTTAYTKPFKDMYESVRQHAANEWSHFEEKSSLRIMYGRLLFWITSGEQRTIPWIYVEEIAHIFAICAAAGLGGFFEGWVQVVPAAAVWIYVLVVVPPSEGWGGGPTLPVDDGGAADVSSPPASIPRSRG